MGWGMVSATDELADYSVSIETRVHSHYRDGVVSIGTLVELFGMAGGKLAYLFDGDAGLLRVFEDLEFLAPVYDGDYVRVTARLRSVGRTSRRRLFEAHVTARTEGVGTAPTHGELLDPPLLIARASAVSVTPQDRQRITPARFLAQDL
jgi:3-aminobutyryl-CoA ammonia-lyase